MRLNLNIRNNFLNVISTEVERSKPYKKSDCYRCGWTSPYRPNENVARLHFVGTIKRIRPLDYARGDIRIDISTTLRFAQYDSFKAELTP